MKNWSIWSNYVPRGRSNHVFFKSSVHVAIRIRTRSNFPYLDVLFTVVSYRNHILLQQDLKYVIRILHRRVSWKGTHSKQLALKSPSHPKNYPSPWKLVRLDDLGRLLSPLRRWPEDPGEDLLSAESQLRWAAVPRERHQVHRLQHSRLSKSG